MSLSCCQAEHAESVISILAENIKKFRSKYKPIQILTKILTNAKVIRYIQKNSDNELCNGILTDRAVPFNEEEKKIFMKITRNNSKKHKNMTEE